MTRPLLCLAITLSLAACTAPNTTPAMRAAEVNNPTQVVPPLESRTIPLPDGHSYQCTAYPGPLTCPAD